MAKLRPDFSFDREGRPLSAWLLDLVADDAPARLKAGDVLQGMSFGVPYAHTELGDLDWGEHASRPDQRERFAGAVREAVDASGFPRTDFVRRLIVYRLALHQDWMRRARESRDRADSEADSDKYVERLVGRLAAAGDDEERTQAARRLGRWFCASMERGTKADEAIFQGAESITPAGVASLIVLDALDVALLADRPGLRLMLDNESGNRRGALDALERIGPAALDFAPGLIARLDSTTRPYEFDAAAALASIGRDDPEVVDALLSRLGSRSGAVRSAAAGCLACAGPPLAGRVDEAVGLLMAATRGPAPDVWALEALASVGRDREDALARILEWAAPRPPRWLAPEGFPEDLYDAAVHERGAALGALSHFRRFVDRAVPALVDAFDTFEEYDPDWAYGGEHGRICRTLAAFGTEAAPAVPRLIAYLEARRREPEEERDYPASVLELLRSIGPAAAAALPLLEAIRAEREHDATSPPDPYDPLIAAILAIAPGNGR
ncbi:hypothetical protein [Paludisphaera mucosa]|uniref:HEAT repeat domain-containing protein n=1 Tax=Paludisphaera mucosa TaxID=3030827 RepID=A0ABT6FKN3_9BACT|nr:hypothetical protein [Paludisphaera mucosa]MDG3008131.1 hypothetical protein [Paludisphaera mucosa]